MKGGPKRGALATALALLFGTVVPGSPASAQVRTDSAAPPGRLVDLGGYRLHLLCMGRSHAGDPTVVLSIGAGGFAVDWSLVQTPLSDSARVCSYDRPGFGWSDAGPTPRTLAQEAFELRSALEKAGERPPFILVGQSLGAWVVRLFAEPNRADVSGVVLVEPGNENGYLGYRGQWVIPRTLASARPVPPVRSFAESPPVPVADADLNTCRTGGDRSVRLFRCFVPQDDYFAEEMSAFHDTWRATPHPLGTVPLVEITGTRPRARPPGLTEEQLRSDSLRLDLSRLSSRGREVKDSLSGHHVQRDNPALIVDVVRKMIRFETVLSARDSAALVEAVVADLRASYRPFADGGFVFDATNAFLGPLAMRVLAALRSRDTTVAAPISRTTPRVRFSDFSFSGDTAALAVSVNRCALEPRERVSGTSGTHRYIRIGERWERELRRSVTVGDGLRCPYSSPEGMRSPKSHDSKRSPAAGP